MTAPFVSLAMIVRDPEGAGTLERCLRSVTERPGGPLFDEIVIVLAGRPNEKVREIATRFGALVHDLPADVPLTPEGGLGDFAAARNFSFSLCRGSWIGWLDSDDVWPAPALADEAAAIGLKDFLRSLPRAFNHVVMPYHYDIASDGKVITIAKRTRFVRWADGWTWQTWHLRCHEDLVPLPPNVPGRAYLADTFIEHYPAQSYAERVKRNEQLMTDAKLMGAESWRLYYYLGSTAEGRREFGQALELYEKAIPHVRSEEERYVTLHIMARVLRLLGRYNEARAAAMAAFDENPTRGEAIGDRIHIAVETGDMARAIYWYERLIALPEEADITSYVERNAFEVDLWPHVAACHAYRLVGRHDDAVAAGRRALEFAPYDVAAQRATEQAERARRRVAALAALVTVHEYAMEFDEPARAREIAERAPYTLETAPAVASLRARAAAVERRDAGDPGAPTETEHAEMAKAKADPCCRVIGREILVADPNDDIVSAVPFALRKAQWSPGNVAVVAPYGGHGPRNLRVLTPTRLHTMIAPRARRIIRLERVAPVEGDRSEGAVVALYEPGVPSAQVVRVTFYCPAFAEPWGPWTPERTGIGASEEMVVLAARKLAAAGADVTVFGPIADFCVAEGVAYRPLQQFDHRDPVDVLVSCRTSHLSQCQDLGARTNFVWHQDAPGSEPLEFYAHESQERVTGYLMISDWQADAFAKHYKIDRAKITIVRNTHDPDDARGWVVAKSAHRAVYCSAPFKGLDRLLDIWPLVRARVPDAELCVAYGWQVHDAMAAAHPHLGALKRKIEANMKAPGVRWLDRLPLAGLRELLQSAGVFAYPNTYEETSCRALIRAQVCGCWPVYRPLAALAETGVGGVSVEGEPGAGDFNERFAAAVADAMLSPPTENDRRDLAKRAAKAHDPWETWCDVAGLDKRKPQRLPRTCEVTL